MESLEVSEMAGRPVRGWWAVFLGLMGKHKVAVAGAVLALLLLLSLAANAALIAALRACTPPQHPVTFSLSCA